MNQTLTLQKTLELAMEKWRGEELVAHGDDKARERLVAN